MTIRQRLETSFDAPIRYIVDFVFLFLTQWRGYFVFFDTKIFPCAKWCNLEFSQPDTKAGKSFSHVWLMTFKDYRQLDSLWRCLRIFKKYIERALPTSETSQKTLGMKTANISLFLFMQIERRGKKSWQRTGLAVIGPATTEIQTGEWGYMKDIIQPMSYNYTTGTSIYMQSRNQGTCAGWIRIGSI